MKGRLWSLDVIRGVVMVLMAIDHVRVYSGLPAGGPTPGIFFTRWITHFCAPVFVFLAGASAFLHAQKLGDTSKTARYLVTRGLVLVALELTVLRVAWTFNLHVSEYILAGVIWMIGWCMVVLAALIWLPLPAIAATRRPCTRRHWPRSGRVRARADVLLPLAHSRHSHGRADRLGHP
jgi:uncharacterized membrane protein